jgi:hypothetical protein
VTRTGRERMAPPPGAGAPLHVLTMVRRSVANGMQAERRHEDALREGACPANGLCASYAPAIARLKGDASGGVFELLDSHQRVRLRLSASGVAGGSSTRFDSDGAPSSPASGEDPGY